MSSGEKLILMANLERLQAEDLLRERGGQLSAEALRDAVLKATGDQDAADSAYCQRVFEETPLE